MKVHVKKNDVVVVLSGHNRGIRGTVLSVNPGKGRVVVRPVGREGDTKKNENVKVIRKALRKTQDRPQGGFVDLDRSYHASAVMLAERFDKRGKGPANRDRKGGEAKD